MFVSRIDTGLNSPDPGWVISKPDLGLTLPPVTKPKLKPIPIKRKVKQKKKEEPKPISARSELSSTSLPSSPISTPSVSSRGLRSPTASITPKKKEKKIKFEPQVRYVNEIVRKPSMPKATIILTQNEEEEPPQMKEVERETIILEPAPTTLTIKPHIMKEMEKREEELAFSESIKRSIERRRSVSYDTPKNINIYEYLDESSEEEVEETPEQKKKRVFFENQRELWNTINSVPNDGLRVHVASMFGNPKQETILASQEESRRSRANREERAERLRLAEFELAEEIMKVQKVVKKAQFLQANTEFLNRVNNITSPSASESEEYVPMVAGKERQLKQRMEGYEYRKSPLIDG
jgi:hypothetical protein